ncbi:MAG: hypothetical protein AMXMBFR74_21050 [Parvibaculum sp.]|uniref:class I SAM-dependent methyltransferase n=1 Tax=Parvibaculum sp. TaxID=2024848 RepID=UPI0035B7E7ED
MTHNSEIDRGKIFSRLLQGWWKDRTQFSRKKIHRTCPVCGYHGIFLSVGRPSRWDSRCPNCGSRERHRLMQLYLDEHGIDLSTKKILQFGPEKWLMRAMKNNPDYEPADLYAEIAKFRLDITKIDRPDNFFDVVIANHVFEHVDDDKAAMREMFRVLKPGGYGFFSVPINLSRAETYENPAITDPDERFVHFGGTDHKRFYGRDFAEKLEAAGFKVEAYRRKPEEEAKWGLLRDECIYIARK